jgi:hypothetical protein
MKHRRLIAGAVIAVVLVIAGVLAIATMTSDNKGGRPDPEALAGLQSRLEHDTARLAREGIYVQEAGQSGTCVVVGVVNPTGPNVAYLRRRFGEPLCIEQAAGPAVACAEFQGPTSSVMREVPDLRDLGIYQAGRRAIAHGFAYTDSCPDKGTRQIRQPSPLTPEALVRVTAQCPAAGTRAPTSVPIALQAEAVLPGGFTYRITAFRRSFRAPRCVRGRPQ